MATTGTKLSATCGEICEVSQMSVCVMCMRVILFVCGVLCVYITCQSSYLYLKLILALNFMSAEELCGPIFSNSLHLCFSIQPSPVYHDTILFSSFLFLQPPC